MRLLFIRIAKASLARALQDVARAVSPNHPNPILAGIYLEASVDGLLLKASNTSLSVECRVPPDDALTVKETGRIVVPARHLIEIARRLPSEPTTLAVRESRLLTIEAGSAKFRLRGMDAELFPARNDAIATDDAILMRRRDLKSVIRQVAGIASVSESRPILTGVRFDRDEAGLRFVATDGVRFAARTLPYGGSPALKPPVTIPARNLHDIARMLPDDEELAEITMDSRRLNVRTDRLQIQTSLLEGAYPSVQRFIPQGYLSEAVVHTASLLDAAERIAALANDSIASLATGRTGKLALSSRQAEIGEAQDEVAVESSSGDPFALSLNGPYLVQLLRVLDCERVRLRYAGPMRPLVLQPAEAPASALYLIAPVRTAI